MADVYEARVLTVLSDNKERHITAVCLVAACSPESMQAMAERGLVRFPDVLAGGKRVCITPKGHDMLLRLRKADVDAGA